MSPKPDAKVPSSKLFLPARREAAVLAVLGVAAASTALVLRYGIIQNSVIGVACEAGEESLTCKVRLAVILTFVKGGWGLLPSDFAAYKRQRHRWAYGGVQLIKKHWRAFLPGRSLLTPRQRSEYLFGWLTWLVAEAFGVLIAILNLIWMPLVAFLGIAVPEAVLTLPVLATFAVMLLHFLVLYHRRVQAPIFASLGAALSAMALQFTVGRAVADGVIKHRLPFVRTTKGAGSRWSQSFPAFWEAILGGLLMLGALTLHLTNEQRVHEISIFSAVLLVQSLPFLAAVCLALLERSPFNGFAPWRRLATVSTYLPRLPRGPAPTAGSSPGGGVSIMP